MKVITLMLVGHREEFLKLNMWIEKYKDKS